MVYSYCPKSNARSRIPARILNRNPQLSIQASKSFTLTTSSQSELAKNLGVSIGGGVCTALVLAWLIYNKIGAGGEFTEFLHDGGKAKKWKDVDKRFYTLIKDMFSKYASSNYIGNHQIKDFEWRVLNEYGLTYDASWVISYKGTFDLDSVDTIVDYMLESTNKFFMIRIVNNGSNGWGHRIGLLKANGSYYLYDPNLGVYTSTTSDGLKDSLRDMFQKIPLYKTSNFWSVIPFAE